MARWKCILEFPVSLSVDASSIAYLQSLRFVVGKRLETLPAASLHDLFLEFLECASPIEPTEPGNRLGGDHREYFTRGRTRVGCRRKSPSCCLRLKRGLGKVATGDKRAVCSCPALIDYVAEVETLRGSFVSLEQILARLLVVLGADSLRRSVCSDADADTTARICFACSRSEVRDQEILQALASYQSDLAKNSECFSGIELGD